MQVNGDVAVLGRQVDPNGDRVEVDGIPVPTAEGVVYYLLHKPRGVITTASDTHGRRTVTELVPSSPRVYPVGRLDADTEGLLILTNDGELTHRLTHPSFGVEKEYLAEVDGDPSPQAIVLLRRGVELEDGLTAPARVGRLGASTLRITIHEGRNRQVRRMCEAIGHPVRRLVRTRVGPISDRQLKPGEWRALSPKEVRGLWSATSLTSPG